MRLLEISLVDPLQVDGFDRLIWFEKYTRGRLMLPPNEINPAGWKK